MVTWLETEGDRWPILCLRREILRTPINSRVFLLFLTFSYHRRQRRQITTQNSYFIYISTLNFTFGLWEIFKIFTFTLPHTQTNPNSPGYTALPLPSHKYASLPRNCTAAVQTPRGVARFDGFRYIAANIEILHAFCQFIDFILFVHCWLLAVTRSSYSQNTPFRVSQHVNAMREIIETNDLHPQTIVTDHGTEFVGREFEDMLVDLGIRHYTLNPHQPEQNSIVERFNGTLKRSLWQQMHAKRTRRWVHQLPVLTSNYNNLYHRSIWMSPNEAADYGRRVQVAVKTTPGNILIRLLCLNWVHGWHCAT